MKISLFFFPLFKKHNLFFFFFYFLYNKMIRINKLFFLQVWFILINTQTRKQKNGFTVNKTNLKANEKNIKLVFWIKNRRIFKERFFNEKHLRMIFFFFQFFSKKKKNLLSINIFPFRIKYNSFGFLCLFA